MSYLDRLLPGMKLTSPNGDVFNAIWADDPRVATKQLGVFNYPNVNLPSIQDLGVSAIEYPLTLSFPGVDNDLVSTSFFNALTQKGPWFIDHPSKGLLRLQPVSFQEMIAPVKSGDLTVFQTNWLDYSGSENIDSPAQISALVNGQASVVANSSLDQLKNNADQSSVENVQGLKSATEKNLADYETTIKNMADTDPDVAARSNSILRSIRKTIAVSPVDLTVLGGQIQALISAPAVLTDVTLQSLRVYQDFVEKVIAAPGLVASRTNMNIALINEIFLISAVSTVNLISSNSEPATRSIALSNLDFASEIFDLVTVSLDQIQEVFEGQFITDQYFSQSDSFVNSLTMTAQTIAYLLSITFNLSIEKRFLLKEGTPAIIVCVNEYGELGDDDEKFDFFVNTNNLQGSEILFLDAGHEVVVYV